MCSKVLFYFRIMPFLYSLFILMTLVVPTSYAAPGDIHPRSKGKSLIDIEKNKTNQIYSGSPKSNSDAYFFPYKSSFSMRTGAVFNFEELNKKDGDKKIPILLGAQYMLESENPKHQEYGVNYFFHDKPKLYIHGGYKYIVEHTERLRPYFKAGLAIRFDEGDYLETPFDLKSYSLVASAGIEDITKDPNSIRVDFDIHWGPKDFLAICALGWSTAF